MELTWTFAGSQLDHAFPETDGSDRSQKVLNVVFGRLELAKDVSAFANSGAGILVIGLKTTSQLGLDVVETLIHTAAADARMPMHGVVQVKNAVHDKSR